MYAQQQQPVYDPNMQPQPGYDPNMQPQPGYDPNMQPQPGYDPNMYAQQQQMQQQQLGTTFNTGYDPNMYAQPQYDPNMYAQGQTQGMSMYGQPPPGGYDPQMSALQAADQAQAKLEELEESQAEKDKKRRDKEIERLAHTMRSGNRNQEDNASCATMLCFWGIFNGLLWAVPLLGDDWWNKVWQGTSVNKLSMKLGLRNMWVGVECTGTTIDQLCHAMQVYGNHDGGLWSLADLRDKMCQAVPGKCGTMNRLYEAGYPPMFLLPGAAGAEVLAILLFYFYWHGKPTALARNTANKLAVLAPALGIVGFIAWMLWSPYMHELPRIWAEEAGNVEFANSSIFGMKETFTLPMGWCCLMAFAAMISSMIRFFVQWTMPFHIHEPDPLYDDSEHRALLAEAERRVNQSKDSKA
jgi:hypothetical protein